MNLAHNQDITHTISGTPTIIAIVIAIVLINILYFLPPLTISLNLFA